MPALRYVEILVLVVMANCEYVHGLRTNPPVENGGTAVVVAPENAANVTVFCEVTFGNEAPRVSTWFLTPKNGARERVRFDSESNFDTSGYQSNFIFCRLVLFLAWPHWSATTPYHLQTLKQFTSS